MKLEIGNTKTNLVVVASCCFMHLLLPCLTGWLLRTNNNKNGWLDTLLVSLEQDFVCCVWCTDKQTSDRWASIVVGCPSYYSSVLAL
jgi:hypothetical protein